MEVDIKHVQQNHSYTCVVAGPTSSGKTYLVRDMLKSHKQTMGKTKKNHEQLITIWAYGQWQPLYTEEIENIKCTYIEGLPSEEEIDSIEPDIIVIDDLMTELANDKKLANLFTKGSHHKNISVIFISQNIFQQGTQMRTVSLNCHYIILMKNPRDRAQILRLASQIYPNRTKFFLEAYNDATKSEFGYIRIDLTQQTPEKLRLQTNIVPDANGKFSPIAYIAKNNV